MWGTRKMKRMRSVVLAAAFASAVVLGGVESAGAATAQQTGSVTPAAAVCYWTSSGTASNCDGRNPDALGSSCHNDAETVKSVVMKRSYDGVADGPTVQLRYSPSCR